MLESSKAEKVSMLSKRLSHKTRDVYRYFYLCTIKNDDFPFRLCLSICYSSSLVVCMSSDVEINKKLAALFAHVFYRKS